MAAVRSILRWVLRWWAAVAPVAVYSGEVYVSLVPDGVGLVGLSPSGEVLVG